MAERDPKNGRVGAFAVGLHVLGATPIDPDEAADLIPATVRTLPELDAIEQLNTLAAMEWALRPARRASVDRVLTEQYLLDLHRRMFDQTWRWAGQLRRSDKNIGVHWPGIRVALRERLNDARHWMASGTYAPDEIAVRFHHALVLVHPFSNGNGRWSRLVADGLLHAQRYVPLTWGAAGLSAAGDSRAAYLSALRAADQGDFTGLVKFARG